MSKNIDKLARKLKAKELEIKILKDLEWIEQQTNNKQEFLKKLRTLLLKLFRMDYCFFVLKEKNSFSLENTNFPFEYDQELFIEITKNIITSERPLIIGSTRRHRKIKEHKIKSLIATRINTEDFKGAVILGSRRKRKFIKLDLWKLLVITKCLTSSLSKIKLKEELKDKNKELEIISKIDYLRNTLTDNSKLVTAILKEIKNEIKCEISYFYLKTEKEEFFVEGKSTESKFVKDNKEALIRLAEETLNESDLKEFQDINLDIKNSLCAPIMVSEESQGVIGLVNAEINEQNKKILQTITKQTTSAFSEDWEKKQIKNVFSNYVSPGIIEMMLKNKEKDYLKTKKEEVTILFSDIRGFTKLSEKAPPEKIVEMLNDHFNTMTEIILNNKGMVDKFIGDAIMAIWGVPIYQESQAFRAVKAALEMQEAQKKLERKYAKEGYAFRIGIGINTGEAIVGNVGSNLKMDYTVMGDMVNVASRMCSAAKANQVIITENTYRESRKSIRTLKLDPLKVKNKSHLIQAYEVIGLKKNAV